MLGDTVAPAMIGGRGLKPAEQQLHREMVVIVAPAMIGGRGLKQQTANNPQGYDCGCTRHDWRAWIETALPISTDTRSNIVAPAMIGGRGLLWVRVAVICCYAAPAPYGV